MNEVFISHALKAKSLQQHLIVLWDIDKSKVGYRLMDALI